MSKGSIIFAFLSGAAIGSIVTWKLVKTKYERIAQEEIDSVKEVYASRQSGDIIGDTENETPSRFEQPCDFAFEEPSLADMEKALTALKYAGNHSRYDISKNEEVESMETIPYVISPDSFGEMDDYETISLTYYADGVLADDADEPIGDVDEVVGEDSLKTFGEYEDDSVFVRNDRLKCDYEILLDNRRYSDLVGTPSPYDDTEE